MSDAAAPSPAGFRYDPEVHPRRLNLGCGFDHREGYLNVDFQDFHHPDLLADVRDLTVLPDAAFDEVLAIDVLEHLPRTDTERCLREWARVLRPGGELRLQVPDVVATARLLAERDRAADHEALIAQLWGTQAYTGDFHLAGFTDVLLVEALHRTGYDGVRLAARDGWMLEVRARRQVEGDPRPLAVGWLRGAYDEEVTAAGSWRWTDGHPELLLVARGGGPLRVAVAAGVVRPTGGTAEVAVQVTGEPREDVLAVGPAPSSWRRVLTVADGPVRVAFATDAAPIDAPDDVRTLVFQLVEPTVRVVADDEPDVAPPPRIPPPPLLASPPEGEPASPDLVAPPSPVVQAGARAVRAARGVAARTRRTARAGPHR